MIEYPKALYRSGWDDLSDFVTVENEEQESSARTSGFKPLVYVAEIQQTAHNDTTPKRRGRPPKVTT